MRIKDQIYKVPERIIIGRGEPFHMLNDNRQIARLHLLLIQKDKSWIIKDLGSEAGTKVNGKPLEKKKFALVKEDDLIEIGGQVIKIMATRPAGEFTEIHRTFYDKLARKRKERLICLAIASFVSSLMAFTDINQIDYIFISQIFIFTFLLCWLFNKIRYLAQKSQMDVSEVFLNKDGFTVYYTDGKNMTFKGKDIEWWHLSPRSKVLEIGIYNEIYMMKTDNNFTALIEYLKTSSEARPNKVPRIRYAFCMIVMALAWLMEYFFPAYGTVLAATIFAGVCFAFLFNREWRNKWWPQHVTRFHGEFRQIMSVVMTTAFFCYLALSSYESSVSEAQSRGPAALTRQKK